MIYALLMLATAAGVTGFWLTWFREDHDEPGLPEGYVAHERIFVWSDAMLSLVLVAGAVLLIAGEPLGDRLALVASGMLLFLGVLDLVYFAQNGLFRRDRDGLTNLGVVAGVLLVGAILFVRFGILA